MILLFSEKEKKRGLEPRQELCLLAEVDSGFWGQPLMILQEVNNHILEETLKFKCENSSCQEQNQKHYK